MDLNKIYDVIDNERIFIINNKMINNSARIFSYDNNCFLFIDNIKFENSIHEKEVLSEELGHYYYNALYDLNSTKQYINKCEYKAKKWSYFTLVPYKQLKNLINNGVTDIDDLINYFEVSEKYLINCINFYINKYGKIA